MTEQQTEATLRDLDQAWSYWCADDVVDATGVTKEDDDSADSDDWDDWHDGPL